MAQLSGCASKDAVRFRERVPKMSDAQLWTYYRGLNEQMKGISHDMDSREPLYQPDRQHWVNSTPYSPGGEGYRLLEQMRLVEAEMRTRGLLP